MKVTTIGGGTGHSILLSGLKHLVPKIITDLSAIVTVTDNGGSSGRLRQELNVLAPGDIRNCIVALGEDENILSSVFQYRFDHGEGLKGHSFGNLFLTALTKTTGSFLTAIDTASYILKSKGKVLPCTLEQVNIVAQFSDGKIIKGESQITEYGTKINEKWKIKKIWLDSPVRAPVEAINKIRYADYIILGPGSLYTSIIPNLLVEDIKTAILQSKAYKIYICNPITQSGETDDYTASDHIQAIHKILGRPFIDAVVTNAQVPHNGSKKKLTQVVIIDTPNILKLGIRVYAGRLIDTHSKDSYNHMKLATLFRSILVRKKGSISIVINSHQKKVRQNLELI